MALILLNPKPSFADRLIVVRQYTTLTVGDLSNGNDNDVTYGTDVFNYNQPIKLTVNCERPGGDIDLKKGGSK